MLGKECATLYAESRRQSTDRIFQPVHIRYHNCLQYIHDPGSNGFTEELVSQFTPTSLAPLTTDELPRFTCAHMDSQHHVLDAHQLCTLPSGYL